MKYGFKVYQVDIEGELVWFAESKDLEGCAGQGETCDEAIKELEENEIVWLEMAKKDGDEVPNPSIEKPTNYSGKFTVRLSKSLHQKATEAAQYEGVSLNTFVIEAISERVGGNSYNYVLDKFERTLDKFANIIINTKDEIETVRKYNAQTATIMQQFSQKSSYFKFIN